MEEFNSISEREKIVLFSLIRHYINTNEPVGSRTLSKKVELGLSPATIRNIMSDLEEKGFLKHPHTSAGRIPTEKGYRLFVNDMIHALHESQKSLLVEEEFEVILTQIKERATMLSKISTILSDLSHYVGIVLAPKVLQLTLKHIDFINMGGNLCLVLFVSQSGLVYNRMVEMKEIISQEQLDKMARFINHEFEGLSLLQIKRKIIRLMSEEKTIYDTFIRQSIELSKKAIEQEEGADIYSDIYVNGQLNILDIPEFASPEKMRAFFSAFEKKENLIKIMEHYQKVNSINVLIGSENKDTFMNECSLVLCPYQLKPNVRGLVGVIGPTRMRYWDVISVVNTMAMLTTKIFQQNEKEF